MWKNVRYTKGEINVAGQRIIDPMIPEVERRTCLDIIDNWRAAHAYPMNTFAVNLRRQIADIEGAFVAQRLKRLDTICGKLVRFPQMELYRMQDLGGCRVIVPTVEDVYKVKKRIETSRIRHEPKKPKDYIKSPNPETGYRGVHLIYKYKSDKNTDYNGLLIEIQIRSKLQHLWATAVEMVGFFTHNGLKFNQGDREWITYFKYVSELFAIEEGTSPYTNDTGHIIDLIKNILELEKKLNVAITMSMIALGVERIRHTNQLRGRGYYLLVCNREKGTLQITGFPGVVKGLDNATAAYNAIERNKGDKPIDAVLVSTQSYEMLINAYPNYFANIREYCDTELALLEKHLSICEMEKQQK